MPEIQILPAESKDLPELSQLKGSYETSHVWQLDRVIEDFHINVNLRLSRLPRSLKVDYPRPSSTICAEWLEDCLVLVARWNGKIVGYIRLNDKMVPNTIWVTDLVVEGRLRRQGIATALILAVQDWALQRGTKCISIEMQSKNHPAIKMVQKLGYEFSGYIDHYYSNHDIAVIFSSFIR